VIKTTPPNLIDTFFIASKKYAIRHFIGRFEAEGNYVMVFGLAHLAGVGAGPPKWHATHGDDEAVAGLGLDSLLCR
jgi:hypothetical protein